MNIITIDPTSSGSHSAIQTWNYNTIPSGYAVWPDTVDTKDFYQYNGFVNLSVDIIDNVQTVINYTPNLEAWEAWKASFPPMPDPEPTDTEVLNTLLGVTE